MDSIVSWVAHVTDPEIEIIVCGKKNGMLERFRWRFFLSRASWSAYRCRSLVSRDERLKEDKEDAVQQIGAR